MNVTKYLLVQVWDPSQEHSPEARMFVEGVNAEREAIRLRNEYREPVSVAAGFMLPSCYRAISYVSVHGGDFTDSEQQAAWSECLKEADKIVKERAKLHGVING